MRTINESNFKETIQDNVVVQFSAVWCGPCKALTRTIETNEKNFDLPFYKIDIDEATSVAKEYGVRSVPTLILFKAGQEVSRVIGNQPLEKLNALIKS